MTSHEFAKQLLAGPDLLIQTPLVFAYSDDEEDNMRTPLVEQITGQGRDGNQVEFLMITYADQ